MSGEGSLRAIVPMKPAYEGKSRLADVLDPEGRAALCLLLLQHVLRAIGRTATPLESWVVGGDQWVRSVACQESACWQEDPGGGLNEVIQHATSEAFRDGVSAVLVLPGDLGLLRPEDMDNLVAFSHGLRRAVLVRAAADGGTNAILAPRGQLVGLRFGPDSFRQHLKAASDANIPVEVSSAPGLTFDLDTPRDLAMYWEECPNLDEALMVWRQKLRSPVSVSNNKASR